MRYKNNCNSNNNNLWLTGVYTIYTNKNKNILRQFSVKQYINNNNLRLTSVDEIQKQGQQQQQQQQQQKATTY